MAVNLTIKQLRKTAAQWTSDNTILADGVLGFETDTGKYKIGDGVTAWNSLSYPTFGSTWGSITGTLSDQTDLQSALDLKANLAGAAFTGDVSVTTSGSGDTLQLTNSGSGTTLNILNSGSGDFFAIDTNKLVVSNNGNLAVDTDTLFVDATNDNVGVNISPAANFHVKNNGSSVDTKLRLQSASRSFDMSVLNAPSVLELTGLSNLRVNFANNSLMELSNNGLRIGNIGTANARLQVYTKTSSTVGAIIQAAAGQTANLQEWKDSAGNVLASVSGGGNFTVDTNTLFVDATNNRVGVGTTNPTEVLHVEGSGMVLRSTSYTDSGFTISDDIYDYRIGTSPPQLRGNFIHIQRNSSNTLFNHSSGAFKWADSSSEKMQLTSGGNLLVGTTTNAGYKLDVNGNGRFLASSTSTIPLIIQAAAGQTANTFEIRDSGSNLELYHSIGSGLFVQNYSSGSTIFTGNARGSGTVAFELRNLNVRRFRILSTATQTTFESSNQTGGFVFNKGVQINSTTQGFLPPVMTGAQVEAIATPAEGLIAYATNAGAGDVTAKGLYIYNGTNWVSL